MRTPLLVAALLISIAITIDGARIGIVYSERQAPIVEPRPGAPIVEPRPGGPIVLPRPGTPVNNSGVQIPRPPVSDNRTIANTDPDSPDRLGAPPGEDPVDANGNVIKNGTKTGTAKKEETKTPEKSKKHGPRWVPTAVISVVICCAVLAIPMFGIFSWIRSNRI